MKYTGIIGDRIETAMIDLYSDVIDLTSEIIGDITLSLDGDILIIDTENHIHAIYPGEEIKIDGDDETLELIQLMMKQGLIDETDMENNLWLD